MQLQQSDQIFRKGDPVWWEPKDPIKARNPQTVMVAGELGTVNPKTGEALLLRLDEYRHVYGTPVPIAELRHRRIPG